MTGPYADAAATYQARGWAPIRLAPGTKAPPPAGWTGYNAPYPSGADVHEWATNGQGTGNVGLRMPETVIGIDVDAYGGKPGAATLADAEARLGPLPPSPVSTSRDDGSGIRFYRVPPGRCWADVVGPGVEVVHHGHRYAVAAPSVHPEGRPYRWLDADGNQVPGPAVDDLPALPPAWVDELDRGSVDDRVRKVEVSGAEVTETLAAMPAGDPCPYVGRVLAAAEAKLADAASRHDVTRNDVLRIVRAGHQGHEGARVALDTLEGLWRTALRQGTPRDPDPGEWARSVSGAVAIVLADPTPEADRGCCTPPAKVPSEADDGYDPDALEDAHLSQRIAVDWLDRRYCWAAGLGWLRWDGRRWKPLSDAGITEVVRKALRKYAADEVAGGANAARMKALTGLLAASKIRAVVNLARGIVEVESSRFDQHPDLLNVGNGVIELATGKLLNHDPALNLTRITRVDYVPGARHDDWDQALSAVSDDTRVYMQVRVGQAATGHMAPDDIMPVIRGSGANGKTTFVKPIYKALGDHAVVIPDRVLLANPGDHPTEMMTLRGARLALLEELPEGRHLNVKRLKDTVGTSPITARAIAKDNITWDATHTLMLTTNYLPIIDEVDHGTWRRLALIEFPNTYTANGTESGSPGERIGDEGLRQRLTEGSEGRQEAVLAWIVEGARRWYDADKVMPNRPPRVVADTNKWQATADRIFAYFHERLVVDPTRCVTAVDLFTDFSTWHQGHGNRAWSDQTFTARFEHHSEVRAAAVARGRIQPDLTHGLSRPTTSRWASLPPVPGRPRGWFGIRFRTEADDDDEQADDDGAPLTCDDRGDRGRGEVPREDGSFQTFRQPRSPRSLRTEPAPPDPRCHRCGTPCWCSSTHPAPRRACGACTDPRCAGFAATR